MSLPTKKDLVDRIGMSIDYWDDQVARRLIPHTRIGRKVFFTEAQIAEIVAMHEVQPKVVPTSDRVSRIRNGANGLGLAGPNGPGHRRGRPPAAKAA